MKKFFRYTAVLLLVVDKPLFKHFKAQQYSDINNPIIVIDVKAKSSELKLKRVNYPTKKCCPWNHRKYKVRSHGALPMQVQGFCLMI